MIKKIYIKNFRSIGNLIVDLSFAEGKAPNDYEEMERLPFIGDASKRCVPIMAIFGANAAGKSNIIRALTVLMRLISGRNIEVPDNPLPHDTNQLLDLGDDIELAVDYSIGAFDCSYRVAYNEKGLKDEEFFCDGVQIYKVSNGHDVSLDKSVQMPSSEYNPRMFSNAIKAECSDERGRFTRTFAFLLGERFRGLDTRVKTGLFDFARQVVVMSSFSQQYLNTNLILPEIISRISAVTGRDEENVFQEIVSYLRQLDVDIVSMNQRKFALFQPVRPDEENGQAKMVNTGRYHIVIESTHKDVNGNHKIFNFMAAESDGTIRVATLLAWCLLTLESGGTLCVDELETSLHPLLVRELLKLFKMRAYNPNDAQLIFTTHLAQLLDDTILRLSEVAIIDKNRWHGTTVRRLSDMKSEGEKIRNVTNFRKRYLMGYYSGVPHAAL